LQKLLKYILISTSALLLLAATASLVFYFNINKIKKYALSYINEHLTAKISANNISISVINSFPNVTLNLQNALLSDYKSDTLFFAESVFFGFNLKKLLKSNYEITGIAFKNGIANAKMYKNGKPNFNIVKEKKNSNDSVIAVDFKLNSVKLNNIVFNYTDYKNKHVLKIKIKDLKLTGDFKKENYAINSYLDGFVMNAGFAGQNYLENKNVSFNNKIFINNKQNEILFNDVLIAIEKSKFILNGKYFSKNNISYININFSANKSSITDLISVLPFNMPEEYATYKSKGDIIFSGKIIGKTVNPDVNIKFNISNASLTEPNTGLAIDNILIDGDLIKEASIKTNEFIRIKKFNANIAGNAIEGNLLINDFRNPHIKLMLNGNLNADFLSKFLKLSMVEKTDGLIYCNINSSGYLKTGNFYNNNADIKFNIPLIKLNSINEPLSSLTGNVKLNSDNSLTINNICFTYTKSNYKINGSINNWVSLINADKGVPEFLLNLNANNINLPDLLAIGSIKTNNSSSVKVEKKFNYKITANLQSDILHYDNFNASDVMGSVKINNLDNFELIATNISLKTCKGSVNGNFTFNKHNNKYYLVSEDLNLKNISISDLFNSFNNFNQNILLSNNIDGFLNTSIQLVLPFNESFGLIQNKIKAYSEISVKNGKLINFKPLYALSKFIRLSELKQLNFSELKNIIDIENESIKIPKMDINSNALNLKLSGTHYFNNNINYDIELQLSELLKRKRIKADNEFGEEDESGKGLTLYVNMAGNVDNPVLKYNKVAVKQKINERVISEKKNIVNIFKTETGIGKKDTTIKKIEKQNNSDEIEFEEN